MNRLTYCAFTGFLGLACACAAGADERILASPGFPPTQVDESGVIHEDWGGCELRLHAPDPAQVAACIYDESTAPTAVTVKSAGSVTLTEAAYRAPIWPGGVDVLLAHLANGGDGPVVARLEVTLPNNATVGEQMGVLGHRTILALPEGYEPVRQEQNPWGCTGGVVAMPGWAKPVGDCDPAFRNICAGMGGVPITYRFTVEPGAERAVALGFCESHWDVAGMRPLIVHVEGTKETVIDPIGAWGRHVPGCLTFAARDLNHDGRIEIVVAPHPEATDRNTILNAIWVFAAGTYLDAREIVAGTMKAAAEYYVDVGGEQDQLLYKSGPLTYDIALEPGAERELLFLLASPGCAAVPNPATMAWTPATLRKAAEDVWEGNQSVE